MFTVSSMTHGGVTIQQTHLHPFNSIVCIVINNESEREKNSMTRDALLEL